MKETGDEGRRKTPIDDEATLAHVDALDVTCSKNQYAISKTQPRACPCYAPMSDDTIAVTPAVPRKELPDMFTC